MSILIKNGIVVDPVLGTEEKQDVLIEKDKISCVAPAIQEKAARVVDAEGCYVMPGFIDLHVHLRDPGLEYKEDIQTGTKAAAHGGFTPIVAMPNTKPVVDRPDIVDYVTHKAASVTKIHVLQAGAVTKGQQGKELADIAGMKKAGSPAISEDGKSVMNAQIYREGMKLAAENDMAVLAHCEDINMVNGGVLNADAKSESLGMKGITNSVEDVIVARDILLAKETGVRLHLCHCSTKDSVQMVKQAKKEGLPVTAEVCPHHFTLTSDEIDKDDSNYKMNPPLRTKEDKEALIEGLKNDIIDVISTDHAPHSRDEKNQPMEDAPFGIVGLETSVALTITELVEKGIITPMQMAEKMSYNPAQVIHSNKGTLKVGAPADVTIIDPEKEYVIDSMTFLSRGKNTPFNGWKVKGMVKATICDGKIAYMNQEAAKNFK